MPLFETRVASSQRSTSRAAKLLVVHQNASCLCPRATSSSVVGATAALLPTSTPFACASARVQAVEPQWRL